MLSHSQLRLLQHFIMDPERAMLVNLLISMAGLPWADVLGSPNAALHPAFFYTAKIIPFPDRRSSELAKLRAEVEEIRTFVRTTLTAGARAGAVGAVGT